MEFVLVLPVLLFTMALMINFGVIATWKVRSLTVARQAIWRDRSQMNGAMDPRPADWPQSATLSSSGDSNLRTADQFWDKSPITHPFARGPVVSGKGQSGDSGYIQLRDRRHLEMREGMRRGASHIQRNYALLPKLGSFSFDPQHALLDSRWQFGSMGYGWNWARRAHGWYNFETGPEWAGEEMQYKLADQMIISYPQRGNLAPLDRDDEFADWNERQGRGGGGGGGWVSDGDPAASNRNSPNFYAMLSGCRPRNPECGECQINPQIVMSTLINTPVGSNGLVQRIAGRTGGGLGGIPSIMADEWIQMYQEMIDELQTQLDAAKAQMPPNQAEADRLQAEIDRLNKEIEKLQEFKTSLS